MNLIKFFVSPKPIIIGGFFRSGTSLLRRLLDAHTKVFCAPEIKFWRDFYGEYRDDPYSHVRFFSTVRSSGLSEEALKKILGDSYVKLLAEAAKKHGKSHWAEKNPENLIHLDDWNRVLGDKFVFAFVIRHPLDSLASLQEIGFNKTLDASFDLRVNECIRYLTAGIEFVKRYPKRSVIIRYENLIQDPHKSLSRLLNTVGLNFEDQILREFNSAARGIGIEDPKVQNTVSLHADSIERWRRDLSGEEIDIAVSKMKSILDELGYTVD